MSFRDGVPEASGEYVAVLRTNAGPIIEIINYGLTEGSSEKVFYTVENGKVRILDNVMGWDYEPDVDQFRKGDYDGSISGFFLQ